MTTLANAIAEKSKELKLENKTDIAKKIGIGYKLFQAITEEGGTSYAAPSAKKMAKFLDMTQDDFNQKFPRTARTRGAGKMEKPTGGTKRGVGRPRGSKASSGMAAAIQLLQDDLAALVSEASEERRKMVRVFLTTK